MAKRQHLARLTKIVKGLHDFKGWNKWRRANPQIVPDLSEADLDEADLWPSTNLSKADLSLASLFEASLEEVRLRGANLEGADLRYAQLGGADLREADLSHADLTGADLRGANMSRADLRNARLEKTKLAGANLDKAVTAFTIFANCDLRDVKGLKTVRHEGPSTIGIDTVFRSEGKIPLEFLRGAGVPDVFLEYLPSLTAPGAIQFYSCFISYSTKDQEFADRLHADLQNKGVRCWFAPHDIQAGKKIHEQIDEAIRRYERLLLILSPDRVKSPWVKTEIRKARKREIEEKSRVLFPVSIVPFTDIRTWESFYADEGIDLAEEIREYYIPDFSDWKNHDSYAKGLKKLLGGLKAEASKAA